MRTVQDTASSLPPLVGSTKIESSIAVPADSTVISVGPELNADAVPGFIRNNQDFIAHLTSVTNLQKQKREQQQYQITYQTFEQRHCTNSQSTNLQDSNSQAAHSQSTNLQDSYSRAANSQESFEIHADFFAESQFGIKKEAAMIEDTALQNVLSMDFRIEPDTSDALLAKSVASHSVTQDAATLSKEEQLELATKFLAKIEELLKQTT